jgi:hypothetical protein
VWCGAGEGKRGAERLYGRGERERGGRQRRLTSLRESEREREREREREVFTSTCTRVRVSKRASERKKVRAVEKRGGRGSLGPPDPGRRT